MYLNLDAARPIAALVLALALTFSACANQKAAESDPDDMSAEQHQQAAEREEQKAGEHREQYDPDAIEQRPTVSMSRDPTEGHQYSIETYNPTEHHLEKAKKHERYAKQHANAAETLLAFEDKHCEKFPDKVRASCPLMGQVEAVDDVDKGAKLHIADSVNLEAIADHMRCHFAFGRTQNQEGMDSCPLYLEDLSFETLEEEHAVIIRTDKEANLEAVRQRSRDHVD